MEPMRDQQVREGDPVQFRCRIVGTPDPAVQWYYNNQLIKPSKYFQLTSDPSTGYYGLSIAGVFPEDDGAYKCVARNPAGEVTCIAQLRVICKCYVTLTVVNEVQLVPFYIEIY
jgi:Immunoglobulin I-set domain